MATYLPGLNGASHVFYASNAKQTGKHHKPWPRTLPVACLASNSSEEHLRTTLPASRRACFGFAAAAAALQFVGAGAARADDEPANNGWWVTEFPLRVPKAINKIANKETGTRSFLRNGIYMADIGPSMAGRAYRLRGAAFDLLALEDLLGKDANNYVDRYLRFKSTFMYFDFDKLITAAPAEQKQPFIDLANRLFDSFEMLEQALQKNDDSSIRACYDDSKVILQEVMERMA